MDIKELEQAAEILRVLDPLQAGYELLYNENTGHIGWVAPLNRTWEQRARASRQAAADAMLAHWRPDPAPADAPVVDAPRVTLRPGVNVRAMHATLGFQQAAGVDELTHTQRVWSVWRDGKRITHAVVAEHDGRFWLVYTTGKRWVAERTGSVADHRTPGAFARYMSSRAPSLAG